jgi:hypothetical protein
MSTINKAIGLIFGLIVLYILAVNPDAFDKLFRSAGAVGSQAFGTLQGRQVSGGGISIGGFQR